MSRALNSFILSRACAPLTDLDLDLDFPKTIESRLWLSAAAGPVSV